MRVTYSERVHDSVQERHDEAWRRYASGEDSW